MNREADTLPDPSAPWLIHLLSSGKWGGWRQYALDICTHFRNRGWHTLAVTRDAKAVDDRFRKAGIPLMHAPLRGFMDPASASRLADYLRGIPQGKGIIHVHKYRDAFTAVLARHIAKRPDIRIVATRHSVRPARRGFLFRKLYAHVNDHIFVSRTAYERFRSNWKDSSTLPIPPEKIHILLNSLAGEYAAPLPLPQRGPVTALYAGPVVEGKGIECAIDALVSLRDLRLRLRIVGPGDPDYLDKLRRRAMTRGVMEAIDWRINEEIAPIHFQESHFGISPSLHREAFGLDSLRFMAMGRAQVCANNGAQHEYLRDNISALFVPPGDADALARAMRRLTEESDLRARLAASAFSYFRTNLSWKSFSRKLRRIYLPDHE